MPAILAGDQDGIRKAAAIDDQVDQLYAYIVEYLGKVSQHPLTSTQTAELLHLMEAINDLENIGDVIETDLAVSGMKLIEHGVTISQPTREVFTGFHKVVNRAVQTAIQALSQNNTRAADAVVAMKHAINDLADSAAVHEAQRLVASEPNRLPAYTVEMDIVEKLKRIYYFAKRIAKTVQAVNTEANEKAQEEVKS